MAEKVQVQEREIPSPCTWRESRQRKVKVHVMDVISRERGEVAAIWTGSIGGFLPMEAAANTVKVKLYLGMLEWTKQKLLDTSRVTWMVDTQKIVGTYRSMMGSMILMVNMFVVMAAAAGGVLIYNISMINIRNGSMNLALFWLLGMSEKGNQRISGGGTGILLYLRHFGGNSGSRNQDPGGKGSNFR